MLVESGAPVSVSQAQWGRADPSVTLGIYSRVIGDSHRRAVEQVAGILDYLGLQTTPGIESIQYRLERAIENEPNLFLE